jgi:REP element-mobilizing transposase RayT
MVHGYHVIMGMYGFWLPNDPRGSWSEFVAAWELLRFGTTTKSIDRAKVLTPDEEKQRQDAKEHLKYPPVRLDGRQALAVGKGFAVGKVKCTLTIWACSILPEHVHLVVGRHRYEVEKIANLLKGEATRQLRADNLDPMSVSARQLRRPRSPWARSEWKVFLDTEEAIENAIRYVEENPLKEGKPRQSWSFVEPFPGLDHGGVVTYYP